MWDATLYEYLWRANVRVKRGGTATDKYCQACLGSLLILFEVLRWTTESVRLVVVVSVVVVGSCGGFCGSGGVSWNRGAYSVFVTELWYYWMLVSCVGNSNRSGGA